MYKVLFWKIFGLFKLRFGFMPSWPVTRAACIIFIKTEVSLGSVPEVGLYLTDNKLHLHYKGLSANGV